MSYDSAKIQMGREPVYLLELDLTFCENDYGISPCTATGGAGEECYNCFNSCQDIPNFTTGTKTYRFSSIRLDDLQADGDAPTFPTLLSVSTAPTTLTPGKGLGVRSTLNVQLADHPYTDVGVDPYVSTRTYDTTAGSFWSKLLARNPFYEGRTVRIKTGYLDDNGGYDASNFITRTYFIDTISGPSPKGTVSIVCKDILRFADSVKSQVPRQSSAELTADINSSTTTIAISDPEDNVKDAYDAGQFYIRVDDETMLMSNLTGSNPNYTLTVTRAAMPGVYTGSMLAEEHSEEAIVQNCHFFDTAQIDDIVFYLLNTGAGIDASFLPQSDWQTVIDFGLQAYTFSALLTEPLGVADLLREITEHTIMLWWDERAQEVKMDSLLNRAQDYGPFTDDTSIVADSVSIARDDKSRVSRVWMYYGHRSPVLPLDELRNFSGAKLPIDTDSESVNSYNIIKGQNIFSRWIPLGLATVASEIANRQLNYYKTTKKLVSMTMDAKDDDAWTGSLVSAQTRLIQDETGASPELGYRVLQVTEVLNPGDVRYKYILQSTDQDFARFGLITPDSMVDYPSASDAQKRQYAFISYNDGTFLDGTGAYEIQ